jgi:hypothetical protein
MLKVGENSTKVRKFTIDFYNLTELAFIYDVSKFIMRRRMKCYKEKIGEAKDGYAYDPEQVALVFKLIPLPGNVLIVKVNGKK